jgi:hypothetical protein
VRLDARNLWIERRPVMDEMNPGGRSLVMQRKSWVRGIRGRAARPMIQPHREQYRG